MKRPEKDKCLDDALSETIGSKKPRTDFEEWKQNHPKAVEMLTSRAKSKTLTTQYPQKIRNIIMKNSFTKYAAVVAVVLGVGAISVVGVNIARYYYNYKGQNEEGHHIFYSEGGEGRSDDTFVTLGADEVTDIEQTRRDLEEIELLRQQGKRELIKVEETMRDGTLEQNVHVYKYKLSDDRIIDMREGVGGKFVLLFEAKAKWEEWKQLKKAGPGEDLGIEEKIVEGRVFSFKRERYFLSDGTEIIWSVGTPKQNQ